jgi:hypothetical protein
MDGKASEESSIERNPSNFRNAASRRCRSFVAEIKVVRGGLKGLPVRAWDPETLIDGEAHERGGVVYLQLAEEVAAVGLNGCRTQSKGGADLLVVHARPNEAQDLLLAL